ncbi:MAG: response regulator transcription factor [Gaiellaceae bacterium]
MGGFGGGERAILIADGDRDFRRAAARALAATGLRIREAASGEEAIAEGEDEDVALVVLEVRLEDISGYEVCRRLRDERGDALPILFVSHDRTETFDRVAGLLVGADDYLAKPIAFDELVARVRRHLGRASASHIDPGFRLTGREHEVLGLLARGLGPVEIGAELAISPKTVATHVEHIYSKLGVHTRAQAVAKAFRLALVTA